MSRFRRQKQTANTATVAVFAAAILATGVGSVLGLRPIDITEAHRPPVPEAPHTPKEMISYPGAFKHYFENAFATRDLCLELHGRVLVDGLGSSPSQKVVLGKEGWLFLKSDGALEQHQRTKPFEEAELSEWVEALGAWQAAAAKRGAKFVAMVAPNKASVYPDKMSPRYPVDDRPVRREQLVAAATDAGLTLIDPTRELIEASAACRTYYLTDTHWDTYGAAVGCGRLMEAVSEATSVPVAAPEIEWEFVDRRGGDLSRLIGLSRPRTESATVLALSPERHVTTEAGVPLGEPQLDGLGDPWPFDDDSQLVTVCPEGEIGSAVVHIDSFGKVMLPTLARCFRRCVFVKSFRLRPELLEREQPDVVVLEVVERRLTQPVSRVLAY